MPENRDLSSSFQEIFNRRSWIGRCGAIIGAGMLPFRVADEGVNFRKNDGVIPVFNVRKFGATGNRTSNSTKAFRDTIVACAKAGGGTVLVPPGEYTIGTIELKDNITLIIESGATLFLSQSKSDFSKDKWAMIYADHANNIAVKGGGILDGMAQYVYTEERSKEPLIQKEIELAKRAGEDMRRYYHKPGAMNTFMLLLNDCTNFSLSNVTIRHSPLWNVRLNDCNRVYIQGVHIHSYLDKGIEADGIDICSSKNVVISDSIIVTGDDSIVLKAISRNGKKPNPCENIAVTNCILESSSTPLKIGTESEETTISNVLFNNCIIRNSNNGFGINVLDGATVSNIIFSNITIETNRRHWNWWGSAEMCSITLSKRTPSSKLGMIRNIQIHNIISHVRGTSIISGHQDQLLQDISLSNIRLFMLPENAKDKRATNAVEIENVVGLRINDLSISWDEDQAEKKWQSALMLKNVSDFVIDSLYGRQGSKDGNFPAIQMNNVSEGIIHDSRASPGTNVFVHLEGDASEDITLQSNDMRKAAKGITFENENLKKVVDLKDNRL